MTGIICLDKPQGITSFLAVKKAGYAIGEKKAGHTGTLDPMATGVLPIAFGGATRFIELLPCHDKAYEAVLKFGIGTDTLDVTGTVTSESEKSVSKNEVENALDEFLGETFQLPPMYSAIKKDGVRLYELARKGIEIEREKRKIIITSIELLDSDEEKRLFKISVECSAGTYIRSLARDIGEKIGVPCVLSSLRRTKANSIGIEKCVTLDELQQDGAGKHLIAIDDLLGVYPEVAVSEAQAKRFLNGGELFLERLKSVPDDGYCRVYSPNGNFLGLGDCNSETGILGVKRVYNER